MVVVEFLLLLERNWWKIKIYLKNGLRVCKVKQVLIRHDFPNEQAVKHYHICGILTLNQG